MDEFAEGPLVYQGVRMYQSHHCFDAVLLLQGPERMRSAMVAYSRTVGYTHMRGGILVGTILHCSIRQFEEFLLEQGL